MEKKPCSQPPGRKPGWPDGPDDVINKYGTYEVQSSCGMENDYPMIAQDSSVPACCCYFSLSLNVRYISYHVTPPWTEAATPRFLKPKLS